MHITSHVERVQHTVQINRVQISLIPRPHPFRTGNKARLRYVRVYCSCTTLVATVCLYISHQRFKPFLGRLSQQWRPFFFLRQRLNLRDASLEPTIYYTTRTVFNLWFVLLSRSQSHRDQNYFQKLYCFFHFITNSKITSKVHQQHLAHLLVEIFLEMRLVAPPTEECN